MRFVVDAQLPPALARFPTSRRYAAENVSDTGMSAASDKALWDHAMEISAAIITKDEDFSRLERFPTGWNHPVDKKSLSFQRS